MDKRKVDTLFLVYVAKAWAGSFLARSWKWVHHRHPLTGTSLKAAYLFLFVVEIFVALGLMIAARNFVADSFMPAVVPIVLFGGLGFCYLRLKKVLEVRHFASVFLFLGLVVMSFPLVRGGAIKYAEFLGGIGCIFAVAFLAPAVTTLIRTRATHYGTLLAGEVLLLLGVHIRMFLQRWHARWNTVTFGRLPLIYVAYVAFGFASWTSFVAPSAMECVDQPGVHRFMTNCELTKRRAVDGAAAMWNHTLTALPGVPEMIAQSPRDVYCDGSPNCATLSGTFGFYDNRTLPSLMVKWNRETKEVLNVVPAFSPLAGHCFADVGECLTTSPMTRTILVTDNTTGALTRVIQLGEFGPSYFSDRIGDEIYFLMQREFGPDSVSYPTDVAITDYGRECTTTHRFLLATYNVKSKTMRCEPIRGDYNPGVLGGSDTHFMYYDELTNSLIMGGKLARVDLTTRTVENIALPLWLKLWSASEAGGAATDLERGRLYVNFPFLGVVIFDRNFKIVDFIRLPNGPRPLTFDGRLIYSGSYDEGVLYAIDPDTKQILARWIVGDSVRNVHVDERGHIWTASASGFVEIDPKVALARTSNKSTRVAKVFSE